MAKTPVPPDELDSAYENREQKLDRYLATVDTKRSTLAPAQLDKHSDLEKLLIENRKLKSKLKCFICKIHNFTTVLEPCSHVLCDECSLNIYCACKERIHQRHPCILPPLARRAQ